MIGVIPKMDLSVGKWDLYFVAPDKDSDEQSRANGPSSLPLCVFVFNIQQLKLHGDHAIV